MAIFDTTVFATGSDDDDNNNEASKGENNGDSLQPTNALNPGGIELDQDDAHVDGGRFEDLNAGRNDPDDRLRPGKIEKLVIPHEDIAEDIAVSEELSPAEKIKLRKPNRREWLILDTTKMLTTHLLLHRPNPDGMDEDYYYVEPPLRGPIREELKAVRVFLAYSAQSESHFLLPVKVTIDNSWYESMQSLLTRPTEFFAENEVLIFSDRRKSCYRFRARPLTHAVTWPMTPMQELLGEALGTERIIRTSDHPIYRDLVDGVELS